MFPGTPKPWAGAPVPRLPKLFKQPELLGGAIAYEDTASTEGMIVACLNTPGYGAIWRNLPAGKKVKIRYAALHPAQLTLRVNDGAPIKVAFPATRKWEGEGAYAEVTVPAEIPQGASLKFVFEAGDTPANIDRIDVLEQ